LLVFVTDERWCEYRLFMKPLPWAAANLVCQQQGLKMAVISELATHNYLTSLIVISLPQLNPNVE